VTSAPVQSDDSARAFERGERRPYPRDAMLHEQVATAALRAPIAPALRFDDHAFTYRELAVRARRVSEFLRGRGVRPGSVVAVRDRPSARLITTLLGILGAGAAYLPLDEVNPPERNSAMIRQSDASLVLAFTEHAGVRSATVPPDALDPLLADPVRPDDQAAPLCRGNALDPAYVMYTSGSTGRPKGVVVPHRAVTRLVVNTDYVDLGPADVIAQASSVSFDAATFEIWGALLNGALLTGLPRERMLIHCELAAFLAEERISVLFLTPAVFHAHAADAPGIFRGLRHLLVGGDVMDSGAARRVLTAGPPGRLLNMYGPTEAVTFSTGLRVTPGNSGGDSLTIGRPIANTDVVLLRGKRRAAPGETGELHIGGDGLALGYLGDPELTADRFVLDPLDRRRLYRTGDLARWTPVGAIEFRGRADSQVKIRGYRVEPGEVEAALRRHPAVADAVVLAYGEDAHKQLIGYVVPCRPADTSDIAAHLAGVLPGYMLPSRIVPVSSLPLNANGKVERAMLRPPKGSPL
jgi:amino acid adenylation domain-containing protein